VRALPLTENAGSAKVPVKPEREKDTRRVDIRRQNEDSRTWEEKTTKGIPSGEVGTGQQEVP
jgi:hypothetical protein